MMALRSARGNKCEHCGELLAFDDSGRPNLTWAHIKETGLRGPGRGLPNRVVDIRKYPRRYKLLCWPCHRKLPPIKHPANDPNRLDHVADFHDDDLVSLDRRTYTAYVSDDQTRVVLLGRSSTIELTNKDLRKKIVLLKKRDLKPITFN
jgi:hypothetical protein